MGSHMRPSLDLLIDLAIVLLLIAGVARFRTPNRARSGNLLAAFALLCGLGIVVYRYRISEPIIVAVAVGLGIFLGCSVAVRVGMIHVPAMVALQNGAGGGAAFLVSFVGMSRATAHLTPVSVFFGILGLVTGAGTFSGSMVAFGKLAGLIEQTPIVFSRHRHALLGLIVSIIGLGVLAGRMSGTAVLYPLLALGSFSILLGVVFSIRVGGADMPVLISFLNATTGLAAAFCGIMIRNQLLVACGATVGASGSILTHAMCKAMNRNLAVVLAGIRQPQPGLSIGAAGETEKPPPELVSGLPPPAEERDPLSRAVEAVENAETIIVVPGYGMALAHAQFEVVRLANMLEEIGKKVRFAIHPVAGRMPGHMNVVLAEAEVSYDKLFEMDDINPEFKRSDLALIVGACDVVNPAAIEINGTPISGMPILLAYEAKKIVVCNLDERPGYSGVENPLYAKPGTILLLGDARETVGRLARCLEGAGVHS